MCAVHADSTLLPNKLRVMMCTGAASCQVKTDEESSADLAPPETKTIETSQQDVSLVQQREATPAFSFLMYAELDELQNKDEDLGRILLFWRAGEKPKSHEARIVMS